MHTLPCKTETLHLVTCTCEDEHNINTQTNSNNSDILKNTATVITDYITLAHPFLKSVCNQSRWLCRVVALKVEYNGGI